MPAYTPKTGGRSKSISDAEMKAVQRFLTRWVQEHCTDPDGTVWDQRKIADSLGITQNEFSAWMRDKARPGAPRLIQLHRSTGASLETILGLTKKVS